jgi:hypothetical protein
MATSGKEKKRKEKKRKEKGINANFSWPKIAMLDGQFSFICPSKNSNLLIFLYSLANYCSICWSVEHHTISLNTWLILLPLI